MDKKDKDSSQSSTPNVDPDLEKKVDELMSIEVPDEPITPAPAEIVTPAPTASAPLLPTDKLPTFENNKADENQVAPETASLPSAKDAELLPDSDSSLEDTIGIEDPATNYAVDEIISEESNQILATEDAKVAIANTPSPKKGFWGTLISWLRKPFFKRFILSLIFIGIVVVAAIPTSRYFVLNSLGVRSSSSLLVLDEKTRQPLKNVEVNLSGHSAKTDIEGKASFSDVKLGEQQLTIVKPAFAEVNRTVVVGWGSNPLGEIYLKPVGSQYTLKLTDFLSSKPISKAEATSGEASAIANQKGEIILTLPNYDDAEIEITVTADNYRTEKLKLPVSSKETKEIKMVPQRKAVFVSKRSGTYDVYKVDVDGKNEEMLLEGTGTENEDTMALVSHPTRELAALVSTRGIEKAKDGSLLSSLTLIKVDTKFSNVITDAESVQIIGWAGNKLIYIETTQDVKEDDKYKNKIISYDIETTEKKELASSNYFNDVMLANGVVLYAPAEYAVNGQVGLYKINPDGTNKITIYDKEVWSLFRSSYDTVSVSVSDKWYNYNLNDNNFDKASAPPTAKKSRIYADSSNKSKSLWVDERDGKGVLLLFTPADNKDRVIKSQGGLNEPIRWLDDDHAIYRITSGETADYIISISGGEPKKISDVTNVAGLDRWYYY